MGKITPKKICFFVPGIARFETAWAGHSYL